MSYVKICSCLGAAVFLSGCVTPAPKTERLPVGVTVFDPALNLSKPVAEADFSGWHFASENTIVGVLEGVWVVAYDLKERRLVWSTRTDVDVASPLSVIGDSLFVGLRDGVLLRLKLSNGEVMWKTQLDSYPARPIIQGGGSVYALTAGQQLFALQLDSGVHDWIYDAGFPEGLTVQGSAAPLLIGDSVVIGLSTGELQAISINTGRPVWRDAAEDVDSRFHDVMGDLALHENILLVSRYDGQVSGLTVTSSRATRLWEDKLSSVTASSYKEGYYLVGSNVGEVAMYKADSGKKMWSASTGVAISNVTLTKNTVFASGSNGRIYALDRETGVLRWHDDIQGRVLARPFTYAKSLYFPTGYKNIYGYRIN